MKRQQTLLLLGLGLAAATMGTQAQGIIPSGTLAGVPGAGNTYDYTLTLNNAANATTDIEGFWYAWLPGRFSLPTMPTSASGGSSGWSATVDGKSIQFQGNATDAIAPGSSAVFTFVSTDSPTTLAGSFNNLPIGASVAYPGTINFSGSAPNQEFTVLPAPEPSTFALVGGGLLALWTGCRQRHQRTAGQLDQR